MAKIFPNLMEELEPRNSVISKEDRHNKNFTRNN